MSHIPRRLPKWGDRVHWHGQRMFAQIGADWRVELCPHSPHPLCGVFGHYHYHVPRSWFFWDSETAAFWPFWTERPGP